MNTLADAPLADLLQRLLVETEASAPGNNPALADLSEAELERLMDSKTEYREFYSRLKGLVLPISREADSPLCILARSSSAHSIVGFGTFFGLSTLHFAAALRDNDGGRLISSEFEPSKAERVRHNLAAGGLLDLVELREGDALQTLTEDLSDSIDLILLDGAEALYPEVLALLESRLRPSALVITDNAKHSPEYLTHVRSPANGYLSTPFAEGVGLSMRPG